MAKWQKHAMTKWAQKIGAKNSRTTHKQTNKATNICKPTGESERPKGNWFSPHTSNRFLFKCAQLGESNGPGKTGSGQCGWGAGFASQLAIECPAEAQAHAQMSCAMEGSRWGAPAFQAEYLLLLDAFGQPSPDRSYLCSCPDDWTHAAAVTP